MAASLGLRGIPGVAEAITAGRDILLAEMTGGHVHIAHMSAWTTIEAVRQGKSRGVKVTCEVCPHHFTLTDDLLAAPIAYDTNTKMNPPLREARDRDAMIAGIVDGTVDVISTDHAPHHYDEKNVEFDRAPFGIVGLETAISITLDKLVHTGLIDVSRMVELMSVNPAKILHVPGGSLAPGAAGRHHDPRARPAGHDRQDEAGQQVEEHAVSRLVVQGRRRRHHRRRQGGLRQSRDGIPAMTQAASGNARHDDVRTRAFEDLRRFEVVMDGHFDYGNGFHGKLYLNPHQLLQHPSTIWRVAQDLIDVMPADFIDKTEIVAGPATGGALLAHTMAGLLDGRRPMTHAPYSVRAVRRRRRPAVAQPVLRAAHEGQARADRGRRAQHRDDVQALRGSGRRSRRHRDRHDADHRSLRGVRQPGRAERGAGGIQGAAELSRGVVPDVRGRRADHAF